MRSSVMWTNNHDDSWTERMNRYLVDEATLRTLLDDAQFLRTLHEDIEERTARSEAAITTVQAILCLPPVSGTSEWGWVQAVGRSLPTGPAQYAEYPEKPHKAE